MNTTLINTFNNLAGNAKTQISNYSKMPVQLSQVRKDGNKFTYGNDTVRESALNDLLNIFSIKNDLLSEIKSDQDEWVPLQRTLSTIKKDRVVTAIVRTEGDKRSITKFFKEPIDNEQTLNLDKGFDLLHSYLEKSNENVHLHNLHFNEVTLQIEASIRDKERKVDVFEDGSDIWDTGFSLQYGLQKTSISPFLLRLICTNGMTATHNISQRYFANKELRQTSFNRLINKTLSEDFTNAVTTSCSKLKGSNASLREFFAARDILLGTSKDLADTYFNDSEIQEVYKPYNIRYKNQRWLSSANSNINSYELFNRLTHCASHQKDIPQGIGMRLNHAASELFFKGPDLSFQAPNPFINN